MNKNFTQDISIVFGGSAGEGLQTIEEMCDVVLHAGGYHVFSASEYMSRVRGGSNSTEIRVGSTRVRSFAERIDILFPFGCEAIARLASRISPETIVVSDEARVTACVGNIQNFISVPFVKTGEEIGGAILVNVVMAGFVLSFFDADIAIAEKYLAEKFARKGEEVVAKNVEAIRRGWALGKTAQKEHGISVSIAKRDGKKREVFLKGERAIALGALAGGCDCIASYPMSPSTGVFSNVAGLSRDFGIAVEQVEDEISGVHMGIGAWFAGGRAMISTSGGGFALMTEAVSLCGMTESPMVFHIAQRPGPATGLPTQTEQGDLNMVLHAGHGDFARVILAPGTLEDGVVLMKKAFDFADKFQVPAFVLTDQFFMDTQTGVAVDALPDGKYQKYFVETNEKYKRYALTGDGLSPRGIPGFGTGFVCADSDEHEEDGHITESHETRVAMVEKRLARIDMLREEAVPSELVGSEKYSTLLVGWGSTYGAIRDALEATKKPMTSFLHIKQVYPMGADTLEYLHRADRIVVIENNATGQLADLIEKETGKKVDDRVLQYDGTPLSVERVGEEIERLN